MNGNKPTSVKITISNGEVLQIGTTMTVGDYDVIYSNNKFTAAKVVYRWSEDKIKIGDTMNDPTKYTTYPSTLEYPYYLKHVLDKDNKVTESYVCGILKENEYCLTNGEYGYAANSSYYTGNALIFKKLRDAKIEGIICGDSSCTDGFVYLFASTDGKVGVNFYAGYCYVNADGSSYCVNA